MWPGRSRTLLVTLLVAVFLTTGFNPAAFLAVADQFLRPPAGNVVDKIYLAKQNRNVVDNFGFGVRGAQAALDPNELEYAIDLGPVSGSATANYVYASFFNPSGSGRTAVVKRIAIRANAVAVANYVNLTLRRTTAASAGTQVTAANIPKKHNDSTNPVLDVRHTGVTVTLAGTTNSRLLSQALPGAAGEFHSYRDIAFANDEKIVLQPGEGIALYQEAAGDADQRIRLYAEWEEVTSAPSAQTEFLFAFPRVENAAAANYVYNSFFNPAASGKTAIVKRIWFGAETCDTTAVYTNNVVIRRTSAASAGTAITASDVPKKHTGSPNSVMDFRHTGVTVTAVGGTDARLGHVTPCGAAGQPHGRMEINFHASDEKLILQPGQGIALMSDATGDIDQLVRMVIEWQEVASASTPASQGEYVWASPRIEVAAALNTNFYTFFNPSGSGRTAVVKRLVIRNNADALATYSAFNLRRITAASGGTLITAADLPKKHTGTANAVTEVRWCGAACGTAITATYAGTTDSDLLQVNGPGAVGQVIGQREISFGDNEKLVLQPGEGVGLYIDVLAGDVDQYVKVLIEWDEEASAPAAQGEYLIDIGPVAGSTSANYVYASFFNPAASGMTAVVKRVSLRIDTVAAAVYIPATLRRTTAASAGTQITAANIPKKHTGTANSAMDVRRTGVTVTLAGAADSRLTSVHTPGAVGSAIAPSLSGHKEFLFTNDEQIILQPGQGMAVYQEAAGDADFRVKVLIEWDEVASGSTPASLGEFLMSSGPVAGSTTSGYVYGTFFNPAGSSKNYVVKRVEIRVNRTGTLVAPGYIPATIRRVTAASAGTLVAATTIPKKHTGTADTTAEIRHTNVTATFAGVTDSRLLGVTVPGVVNEVIGQYEHAIVYQDELILKPGEGLALYQEATAGDGLLQFRFAFEWSESTIGGGGSLTVDIVDSGGAPVASPSVVMNALSLSFAVQTATGTFGVASQRVRVTNTTATATWTLSVSAVSTAIWDSVGTDYDFNDPTANAGDGGDTDTVGGQMTLNPTAGTIAPQTGCSTTGLTLGSSTAFNEGVTNSITLITAGASAGTNCYWDLTGVSISQTIPEEQPAASDYDINLTVSVVAT